MTEETKPSEGGLDNQTIAEVLKNIKDPGERAEKEQRLRQFSNLSIQLQRGEITLNEFIKRVAPSLNNLG